MRKRLTENKTRFAVPNQPEDNVPESTQDAVNREYNAPRKNDAAYKSYLKHGANSRNGKVTASESGAKGMANQGEIDRTKHLIKYIGDKLKKRTA